MEITILFYVFAALTVGSALVVVFSRSVIYAAFSLLFTFMGVAGLYVLLSADFIAVAQIMVYIGGILILLVFGVMLTRKATDVELQRGTMKTLPALLVAGAVMGTLVQLLRDTNWHTVNTMQTIDGTTLELGELLMTTFILPFEVAGVLLLVAVMGAALIARKEAQ
ncbi:NADH-quinone oxidoreductase subunit J [bacterium]|nr:NADH-quinone oxidoreductase subunit J [bacterium]